MTLLVKRQPFAKKSVFHIARSVLRWMAIISTEKFLQHGYDYWSLLRLWTGAKTCK